MHIGERLAIGVITCSLGQAVFGGTDSIGLTISSPFLTSTGASACIAAKKCLDEEHRARATEIGLDYDTDVAQLRRGHLTEKVQQIVEENTKIGRPEKDTLSVFCKTFNIKQKRAYTRDEIRSTTSAVVVSDL